MDGSITPKDMTDPILKLSEYIQDYPFLVYGVIAIFGLPLTVVVVFYMVNNLIVTVICIILLFLLLVHCGNLESKAKTDDIRKTKRGFNEIVRK